MNKVLFEGVNESEVIAVVGADNTMQTDTGLEVRIDPRWHRLSTGDVIEKDSHGIKIIRGGMVFQ